MKEFCFEVEKERDGEEERKTDDCGAMSRRETWKLRKETCSFLKCP
jgi:hypothetical protein